MSNVTAGFKPNHVSVTYFLTFRPEYGQWPHPASQRLLPAAPPIGTILSTLPTTPRRILVHLGPSSDG
jgi:hypothetical protein